MARADRVRPTVIAVAAMATNRVIGRDGALPWDLPEDLRHFKAVTLGHPMIMGRATFDSIGRALPGRTTIVVTRNPQWSKPSVEVAHSLAEAIDMAGALDEQVFVVGGAGIYADAFEQGLIDEIVLTRVNAAPPGDTYFPALDWSLWQERSRVTHEGRLDGLRITYDIVDYTRS